MGDAKKDDLRVGFDSRLAGYEDVNDAERLAVDPAMRHDYEVRGLQVAGATVFWIS